jgi:hypothetical protein
VDYGARYLDLCRLGREAFLQSAAGAALVLQGGHLESITRSAGHSGSVSEHTLLASLDLALSQGTGDEEARVAVFPMVKKPGAPFSEMITVGRTTNNDIALNDVTVSRFHAYFKAAGDSWVVCDSGSKNGTTVGGTNLEPRKEIKLKSGTQILFGDVETTFYSASDLFDFLNELSASASP